MSGTEEHHSSAPHQLSPNVHGFIQRLYRDPRYLLIGKAERFGRDLIAFVEGCTLISPTGEVRGQALINSEYELRGRPDGERPYGADSLLDYYLSPEGQRSVPLAEDHLGPLREESWQYYVRRNFAFLLEDYLQARDDASHNLAIWSLVEQSQADEEAKWAYLRWWPWIERDRAVAQALSHLAHGQLEAAATELYRAQRALDQFAAKYAEQYSREEGDGKSLCQYMKEHITSLIEILREDENLPVSLEEKFDEAVARGDEDEIARLRADLIRRAIGE